MEDVFAFYAADVIPALNQGLWVSVQLIVPSAVLGLALGIVIGVTRVFGASFARRVADGFVAVIRGTPLVAQLFIWYYGLPNLGIFFDPMGAAVFGFVLCSGAYHSEYIRGALLSIKRGQLKAAQALGFTPWQTIRSVVLPQALRRALPGCGNEVIYLIKYSSLAYIVTCVELTGEGHNIASRTFRYTEVFFLVGAYYLALVTVATWFLHKLETAFSLPGFEARRS